MGGVQYAARCSLNLRPVRTGETSRCDCVLQDAFVLDANPIKRSYNDSDISAGHQFLKVVRPIPVTKRTACVQAHQAVSLSD